MPTFCNYWNKVSLVKSKIKKSKKIDSIGIGLASPDEIRRWGERRLPNGTLIGKVDKDHTVDYESLKPIEGGLFCERIFGPVEDFYCSCERKGEKNEKFCPNCEVEFTKSRVRRIRMGYIPLAVPVVHVWYLRGRPSYIANLVGKSRNSIDRLAYGETLSESFIGYSSLESIYRKEENFFPKTLQREPLRGKRVGGQLNQRTDAYLRYPFEALLRTVAELPVAKINPVRGLPPTRILNQRFVPVARVDSPASARVYPPRVDPLAAARVTLSGLAELAKQRRNTEGIPKEYRRYCVNVLCQRIVSTNCEVLNPPHAALNLDLSGVSFPLLTDCAAEGSETETLPSKVVGSAASEQKYLKCHTLPLFSTFVYKEWSHRFSFLEYFIWSPRNNDLRLPFYAYQNSRSERRLANICESIRKSSINLIKNKFSLRFSNKNNCNHSFTSSCTSTALNGKPEGYAPGPLVLQEEKVRPHSLQLRNKQGVLRFIKVNKNIDSLFYTKPNFSDIHVPHTNLLTSSCTPYTRTKSKICMGYGSPRKFVLSGPLRGKRVGSTAKDVKASYFIRGSLSLRYHNSLTQFVDTIRCHNTFGIPSVFLRNSFGISLLRTPSSLRRTTSCTPYKSKICMGFAPALALTGRFSRREKDSRKNFLAKRIEHNVQNKTSTRHLRFNKKLTTFSSVPHTNLRFVRGTASSAKQKRGNTTFTDTTHTPFGGQCVTPLGYAKQGVSYRKSNTLLLQRCTISLPSCTSYSYKGKKYALKGWDFSEALNLKISLCPRGAQIARINSCDSNKIPFLFRVNNDKLADSFQRIPFTLVGAQRVGLPRRGMCNVWANSVNEGSATSESDGYPLQGSVRYPFGVCKKRGKLYAFSTMQQDTESTPLNKMDTQQFPRLTELLNFTGGAALRNLLSRFDLIVLSRFLRHELKNLELKVNSLLALKMLTYSQGLLLGKLAKRRSKQIRRLKLLELFQSQKSNPEWMILSVIPVLPPDLRPILRVNDDFVVASDLNRLYQTVLRRNNTIHERLDDPLPCPESGLFRQRSLQKAVDGLLENGKGGGTPLCASKRRPLVSLSHVLKGKKGLFRQHLLGKRVDYSGRSVIVVGPRLQLHECGLPKEMAIELFQPFLLHRLKVKGLATSNTTARRMIQQGNPVIWHLLKQLVYEHPVLLNRAPTLHRLGIQAFQPRLVSGRAILLHPLVCNGFNADFDGDQMAVHVPLSFQARAEAWKIMWSKNNFLSPATGQPILVPSQDMVLGCYYLSVSIPRILNANVSIVSHDKANDKGASSQLGDKSLICKASTASQSLHSKVFLNENKGQYFSNLQDSLLAYFQGRLQTHTPFWVRIDHKFAKNDKLRMTNNELAQLLGETKPLKRIPHALLRDNASMCQRNNELAQLLGEVKPPGDTNQKFVMRGSNCVNEVIGLPNCVNNDLITSNNKQSYAKRILAERGRGKANAKVYIKVAQLTPYKSSICKELRGNHNVQYVSPVNKPNIDNDAPLKASRALELTFLQPLYGSSREMCKILFQKAELTPYNSSICKGLKSTNNSDVPLIRVEANETLESPLELRLSVDGNLANILTMFQNHYNYNATWVKQCKEESIKYMRTTAGRVVINDAVFKDF